MGSELEYDGFVAELIGFPRVVLFGGMPLSSKILLRGLKLKLSSFHLLR
jgi:hypothetical protein